MRTAADTDFSLTLPNVGDFTFGRRTMGDMIKIRANYLKLIGEQDDDEELGFFCGFTAAYQVLIVACPAGWENMMTLDLNSVGLPRIMELAGLLSEKENSFRIPTKD